MLKRAEKMLAGVRGGAPVGQGRADRLPEAGAVRTHPLTASELSKSYGSLEVFTDVDLAIDKGSGGHPGSERRRQDHAAADPRRHRPPRHRPGRKAWPQALLGYYAQEHETLDVDRTVLENLQSSAPQLTDTEGAVGARVVLCSPATTPTKPAKVLSGGEDPARIGCLVVSSANVLLLDEPTNNLDPASREGVLAAIRSYEGAIVPSSRTAGRRPGPRTGPGADPARRCRGTSGTREYADLVSLA